MGLDAVEFAMELEEKFGVAIPNELWPELKTVGNVADLVCDLIDLDERSFDRSDVLTRVREITSEQTSIRLDKIAEESALSDLFG